MWKKPIMNKPVYNNNSLKPMSESEMQDLNAGSVGTCLLVGYTCNTDKGGGKVGTCLIVGYSCNTDKGGF